MKFKDLFNEDLKEKDITTSVSDEGYIAFVPSGGLTKYAKKHYKSVLNLEVKSNDNFYIVQAKTYKQHEKIIELATCYAGHCSQKLYDVLFKEVR